jgi:hypothetical protein
MFIDARVTPAKTSRIAALLLKGWKPLKRINRIALYRKLDHAPSESREPASGCFPIAAQAGDLPPLAYQKPHQVSQFFDFVEEWLDTTVAVDADDESPEGLSPSGAPKTVREPLDSYGSRCSAA